jgi:hypothetical protein
VVTSNEDITEMGTLSHKCMAKGTCSGVVILADFVSTYKFVSCATEVLSDIGLPFGAKNFIALSSNLVEYFTCQSSILQILV